MGRTGRSLSSGTVLGYRAAKQDADDFGQMVKFIWATDSDEVSLFDLEADPNCIFTGGAAAGKLPPGIAKPANHWLV